MAKRLEALVSSNLLLLRWAIAVFPSGAFQEAAQSRHSIRSEALEAFSLMGEGW